MNLQKQSYFSVSSEGVPIRNIADYSPFGVQLDGRTISGDFYRRGFNGMEKDDEVKGGGNSYTTEFRQYDSRLGRWLSLDPLMAKFPWQSPYVAFDNVPTILRDPNGLAAEGGPDGGWKKGAKGSRKKDNGNGTTTYDAPKGNVILPERAKIIETLQDGNGNKKVDYNGKPLEGEFGDVYKFNLGGEEYVANYKSGKFNGYVNKAGEMYSFKEEKTKSNEAKIDVKAGLEISQNYASVGKNGMKMDVSFTTTIKESENGITYTSDIEGNTSTSISTWSGTLTTDKESFTYGNSNVALGFTKDEELKISFSIPIPFSYQSVNSDIYLDTKRWKKLGNSIMDVIQESNKALFSPLGGFTPTVILNY